MTGEAPLQSVCVCVAVRDFSLSNRTLRVRKYTTYYQIVGTYELCTCTPPPLRQHRLHNTHSWKCGRQSGGKATAVSSSLHTARYRWSLSEETGTPFDTSVQRSLSRSPSSNS